MALVTHGPNKVRIYIRYVGYLLWEFRLPLGVFAGLVFFGGLALHHFYRHEHVSYARAFHAVFLMIFLESGLDFPDEWYLQPFFFLLPIIGLGAVADSVVRLAFLMFTQKQNLPEWQRMVASLYRNHVVVVGVGKVGYQIIKGLLALRESVVAVDQAGESLLIDDIRDLGVPVIQGNARYHKTLEQAGVAKARAVILATNDDLANLDSGLTARDINPKARIVLRLFDETLARKVEGAFTMPGISTAQVSAPAFIAAATGRKVYQEFQLSGQTVHLTDMIISAEGGLVGRSVGELQADKEFNVVMHQGPAGVNLNPNGDVVLGPDDTILVIAPMDQAARPRGGEPRDHVENRGVRRGPPGFRSDVRPVRMASRREGPAQRDGGRRTVSMTWITPLEHSMSVLTTLDLPIITFSPDTETGTVPPWTVLTALPSSFTTLAARTFEGTTW